jgi:16S rRNA (cytosine967-C5)-methyltransferase
VLDLCAAPGGKTGYIAELMKNKGSITACDIYPHRLDLIKANMKRIGAGITELKQMDASEYESSMESAFDYVLADVPCSGLGVAAGKPEIKLTTDPSDYAELVSIQAGILANAIRYARPGGIVMYSTCTLNKEENEAVVKQVLSKLSGFARIVEMNTLLPYNGKVGFFYSIIRKNAN